MSGDPPPSAAPALALEAPTPSPAPAPAPAAAAAPAPALDTATPQPVAASPQTPSSAASAVVNTGPSAAQQQQLIGQLQQRLNEVTSKWKNSASAVTEQAMRLNTQAKKAEEFKNQATAKMSGIFKHFVFFCGIFFFIS
jgi:hypothetical protein